MMNVTVLQDACQVPLAPLVCRLWGIYYLYEQPYFGVASTGHWDKQDAGNLSSPAACVLLAPPAGT